MVLLSECCHCYVFSAPLQKGNLCGLLFIIIGGSDYNFTIQSFLIYSGGRSCISIEILDDTIVEQTTEHVVVQFRTSPSHGNAVRYYYTYIYIQDNDGK